MMDFPYLDSRIKVGMILTPKRQGSFPFPTGDLPGSIYSSYHLLEGVHPRYFLRSTSNPLFCKKVDFREVVVNVPRLNDDGDLFFDEAAGGYVVDDEIVTLMVVRFEEVERLIGYRFKGEWEIFVTNCVKTIDWDSELDDRIKTLYGAASLNTAGGLEFLEQKTLSQTSSNRSTPKPKGEWEARMFMDLFQGDTRQMSDSEYEMIFGVSR